MRGGDTLRDGEEHKEGKSATSRIRTHCRTWALRQTYAARKVLAWEDRDDDSKRTCAGISGSRRRIVDQD